MSMYAYWLASSGLTACRLALLHEAGYRAQTLYGMEEKDFFAIKELRREDAQKLAFSRKEWNLEERWMRFLEQGIGFVSLEDPEYPGKLRNIHTPPFALYYLGRLPDEGKKRVAIVGSRQRSAYGSQIADALARALAQNNVEVVSGMAYGIDADAHRGALAGGGTTTAVLGCGADVCYPKGNRYLYDKILAGGCILSEYAPQTPPLAPYFPQRNRIISGLCDHTVVVEAREKSGSLITADYAMEQGRSVYALPGRITDSLSQGTNRLIAQGAGVFLGVEDFLMEISLETGNLAEQLNFHKNFLEKDEALVYALLDFYPVGIGTLVEKTSFGLAELLPVLKNLEQKGFIREAVPNYFVKTV